MAGEKSAESMNLRMCINNDLEIIQEDLDNVEKRLGVIFEELLGPRIVPEQGALEKKEKKAKTKGWLNLIVSKLSKFKDQLKRIKELEKDLRRSIISSPVDMPDMSLEDQAKADEKMMLNEP